jgi:hypothetical protein
MRSIRLEVDYSEVVSLPTGNVEDLKDLEILIGKVNEQFDSWKDLLINKIQQIRLDEIKGKIEKQRGEELVKIRRGVCNLELCYADGTRHKCSRGSGHLILDSKKGFRCYVWGRKGLCERVTPKGRLSINRTRSAVLDRFKLTFFKKELNEEIEKVKETYRDTEERAKVASLSFTPETV